MPLSARIVLLCLCCALCNAAFDPSTITLPPGFSIALYQENLPAARSLTLGGRAGNAVIVYVGSRGASNPPAAGTPEDKVWALVDKDGDGKVDFVTVLLSGLPNPNGVAWRGGSLYVGQPTRILRLDDIDSYALQQKAYDKDPVVVIDSLPPDTWHGTKYLGFGPDGKLYFGVGVPCDICAPPPPYQKDAASPAFTWGSLYRMNPDGSGVEMWASGVRNSVGFDWHPQTKKLFFTDNGPNAMGQNLPDDELNYAPQQGMSFGFPYCLTIGKGGSNDHPAQRRPGVGKPFANPTLNPHGRTLKCTPGNFTAAIQAVGPHAAVLGMRFYKWKKGAMFPRAYHKSALLAIHGSSGRTIKLGYNVMRAVLDSGTGSHVVSYAPFADGWLQNQGSPNATVTGRPVDLLQLQDGSLLISDDFAGAVYRVTYRNPA